MKTVVVIPARLDSSRLPGKQLRLVCGKPMLEHLVERMGQIPSVDATVIATTERNCDRPLVKFARERGISVVTGELHDILGRFTKAAAALQAQIVVKANGDNPLLAPEVISAGLEEFNSDSVLDLATGKNAYTKLPVGIGAEVIRFETLQRLTSEAVDPYHRESITGFIFDHPGAFTWKPIPVESAWQAADLSLTVDTLEDFVRYQRILERLREFQTAHWTIEQILEACWAVQ